MSTGFEPVNCKRPNQTLLVAIELSRASQEIVLGAAELAEELSASLLILHVVHERANGACYPRTGAGSSLSTRLEDIAASMLTVFVDEIRTHAPDLKSLQNARAEVVPGLPGNRICEVAERENVSMIMMGGNEPRGISRLLTGSTAEQVRRSATVPVANINYCAQPHLSETPAGRPVFGQEPPRSFPA